MQGGGTPGSGTQGGGAQGGGTPGVPDSQGSSVGGFSQGMAPQSNGSTETAPITGVLPALVPAATDSQSLTPEASPSGTVLGDEEATGKQAPQVERYLEVENATGAPVRLWVQYFSRADDGQWNWYPTKPGERPEGVALELQAGEKTCVTDNGRKLSASRIRFWVESDTQAKNDYRNKDFWLVPEEDGNGRHSYVAGEKETYPLKLTR
jgi:hypothetical protein